MLRRLLILLIFVICNLSIIKSAGALSWHAYAGRGKFTHTQTWVPTSLASFEPDILLNVSIDGGTGYIQFTGRCEDYPLGRSFDPNWDPLGDIYTIAVHYPRGFQIFIVSVSYAEHDPAFAAATGIPYIPLIDALNQLGKDLGKPENPGQAVVAEPINVGSGNVYDDATDYATAGANKLAFVRYYNSRANTTPIPLMVGSNWRSNYDRYLWIISATTVAIERADGREIYFTYNGTTWTTDSDVSISLTQLGATWKFTDVDDTVETYTTAANGTEAILTSARARNGYTQTLNYDVNNKLSSVTDSYNQTLVFTYQGSLLQTVTTPDGLVLTYGFDSSGVTPGTLDRLISVSYSTTPAISQSYLYENVNLPFALTAIIDENGKRFASWTYDQYGRGLSSQFGVGANLTTVAYDDTNGNRTVTSALVQPEVYHFTTMQGVPKVTKIDRVATATTAAAAKTFTYDGNGYLASESDWNGNVTTYVNDALGRPTTIMEAVGSHTERTTTINYFQNYHLPFRIVAPQITTDLTYDASGNLLTKKLTDTTTTSLPYRTNGQTRTWMYTWANGLLTSVQNPRTDVAALTSFTYDGSGVLVKTTNALGQTVQIIQHTPGGLPLTLKDANGVITQLTYDARLRLTSSVVNTAAGKLTTQYSYDPAGILTFVILPDGSALANTYDIAHRLIGVTDLLRQTIAYALDAAGNRTRINVADSSGTIQRQHTSSFDALGRIMQDTGGAAQQTQYAYDDNGNPLTITNPLSHSRAQGFDDLNRLIQITDPAHGSTTASFNLQDRPQNVVDPSGGNTTYIYDGFGDVIEKVSPDSGVTVYAYDADGNLTKKMDATGAVTNYAYDALDRVKSVTYPASASENVTYTYDAGGHGFGVGRLTTVIDAAGTLNRSYDERGNVVSETRVNGTTTLRTAYGYDAVSHIASITYPSGLTIVYVRDVMGRTAAITANAPGMSAQTVVSNIGYQPFGPVSSLIFGNGITETRRYDNDYRLTQITAGGSRALQNLSYGYDAGDNVLSITDAVTPKNSQSFGYDSLNRLMNATGSYGNLAYTYDSVGNRLTQNAGSIATTYAYAPNSNRLTGITSGGATQSVSYTAAGNISATGSAPNMQMTYSQSGRLATVIKSITASQTTSVTLIAQHNYDAFGRRLVKSTPTGGKTLFQFAPQGWLLEEAGNTMGKVVDYIYLDDGRLIATFSPATRNISYIHSDRLGTPQLATNSAQSVVWSTAYTPFGQTGTVAGTVTQNLRLPGQYFDSETSWSLNGFRDYVPTLGRYLESDPIGLDGGLNTYAYVDGNPVKAVDLSGLRVNQQYIPWSWGNQKLYSYGWAYNEPGVYTIEGHGDPSHFLGNGSEDITPQRLAQTIFNDPNYTPGMPVRLLSCNTGVGQNSYAQQLTKALANLTSATGRAAASSSVVYAPDGYVEVPWSYSFYNLFLHVVPFEGVFSEEPASIIKFNGQLGGWHTFKP